ncbi:MAG: hypothetical protein NXY57DRAFT_1025741 [Lentinula lateritia]|nr:MAG: hypothetical protein NXY57DRAFT_1025741 [Lentinula lateritia]
MPNVVQLALSMLRVIIIALSWKSSQVERRRSPPRARATFFSENPTRRNEQAGNSKRASHFFHRAFLVSVISPLRFI